MALSDSPGYGDRLLPHILDSIAATQPNRIVYSVAIFKDGRQGFQNISASQLSNAVNKTAWWLQSEIGRPATVEPIGYIGPHDVRHVLLTYASVKANYFVGEHVEASFPVTDVDTQTLFLSPKNNIEGALAVLSASKCGIWANPSEKLPTPLVSEFLQQHPMKVLQLPCVDELLDAELTEPFPYTKTFKDSVQEPFCMLHTSGTTGVPKPISWTHGLIGTLDAVRLLPTHPGDNGLQPWTSLWQPGDVLYSAFPMSHGAGIIMNILMPMLYDLCCVLGPPDIPPSIHLIETLATNAKIDIWSMVPSLVDQLGETPDILEKVGKSKFICASGGPVNPDIVSKVNHVIRVLNLTGTTEGLFIGNLVVSREDWFWFAFHPYSGFEFREVEAGTFEHWVHRHDQWSRFQGIFHTFPNHQSINLKDLYITHPTKTNLWAFKGRSDDVIVLSNGYKISPLSIESHVATHPAVSGCLMIGTGRSHAGLLIELKDTTHKDIALLDNIWQTVEAAVKLSPQKTHLHSSYVAIAEPGKPFIRTDKGTIKRPATLAQYTDFIDRFYDSRDSDVEPIVIDAASLESMTDSVRRVFGSSLPEIYTVSPDTDLFSLGLDSLFVVQAVKILGSALNLGDELGPRHIYGNPTITKLSLALKEMSTKTRSVSGTSQGGEACGKIPSLQTKIDQHKARLSFKLNPFDYVNPNHYIGLNFYFPLRHGVSPEKAFANLQRGLYRTLQAIPTLDGKIMSCSEHEIGYKTGDLRLTIPPCPPSSTTSDRDFELPRQLLLADLSDQIPPFEALRNSGFLPSTVLDYLLLPCNPFPSYPADILVARANFIKGGCILATNFHHGCLDGAGVMVAMKAWAENCRYLDGDHTATCTWLDQNAANHSLPEILHDIEGHTRNVSEIDPGTWGFLPFLRPNHLPEKSGAEGASMTALPEPPVWPHKLVWPPVQDPHRTLRTCMFLITPERLQRLKQKVAVDPNANGVTSLSDITQAFFWRAAIRARYRVATEMHGKTFGPHDISILELPIDGRPYFSSSLPSTYMGSMLILNRPNMAVETLCSSGTSIGQVASTLRQAAARITPSLVHSCFTLLQSLPAYERFSLADMGLDSMHAMISNMLLFKPSEISFGGGFFANGGCPESLRPQLERGSRRFRFLVIHPMKDDGGVELVLGTLPEELEMLKADVEFNEFAQLMDG